METGLAKRENQLATQQTQIATPMQQIGQELALVPGVDEEHHFALRKLGTIHLGIKVQYQKRDYKTKQPVFDQAGNPVMVESPKATEYFVLPEQLRQDPDFREKLESMGQDPDKPTRLPIMVMSNDLSVNIVRSCDLYGQGAKLKCRAYPVAGGMLRCIRLNPKTLDYEESTCTQPNCPDFTKGDCKWVTRFRFMLPDQAQLGYWEIITASDNNKGAIARELRDLRMALKGQVALVDLALVLTNERTFHPKVTDRQGNVSRIATAPYLMHIELGKSLRKLMAEGPSGVVIDADQIEESYEADEQPTYTDEGEFVVGEPEPEPAQPETPAAAPEAEVAEFTPEPPDAQEPAPEAATPAPRCGCGKYITNSKIEGKMMTSSQIVDLSLAEAGKALCAQCLIAHRMGQGRLI